ncbi:hypothetical protein AB0C20_36465, partial [Micromonospora sp. NPDC048843]
GHAVSIYDDPFQVAGLPTTSGPSGPRPNVPDAALTATGGDKGAVDTLALNAIDDIQSFWRGEYHNEFDGEFAPVTKFYSWSAKAPRSQETQFCKDTTYHLVNAAYCRLDNSVGWDRAVLLPMMQDSFGKMAVVMVLAHEYGHAIQTMSHIVSAKDPVIVKEQQADCFAGAFMRHVAEDKATHFTINTSDGLNNVLAATVAIRDANPEDPESVHGSAFERVTAVQIGFTDGPKGCTPAQRVLEEITSPPPGSTKSGAGGTGGRGRRGDGGGGFAGDFRLDSGAWGLWPGLRRIMKFRWGAVCLVRRVRGSGGSNRRPVRFGCAAGRVRCRFAPDS